MTSSALADMGALKLAALLADAADRGETRRVEAEWTREAWEARLAKQQAAYWRCRDTGIL